MGVKSQHKPILLTHFRNQSPIINISSISHTRIYLSQSHIIKRGGLSLYVEVLAQNLVKFEKREQESK